MHFFLPWCCDISYMYVCVSGGMPACFSELAFNWMRAQDEQRRRSPVRFASSRSVSAAASHVWVSHSWTGLGKTTVCVGGKEGMVLGQIPLVSLWERKKSLKGRKEPPECVGLCFSLCVCGLHRSHGGNYPGQPPFYWSAKTSWWSNLHHSHTHTPKWNLLFFLLCCPPC